MIAPRRTLEIVANVIGFGEHRLNVTMQADAHGARIDFTFLFMRRSVHVLRPMLASLYHTLGMLLEDGAPKSDDTPAARLPYKDD